MACSSTDQADAPPPTIAPATAAVSPPATQPDGVVRSLTAPGTASVFDARTRVLAVLTTAPQGTSALTLFGTDGGSRTVPLPAAGSALTGDGDGTAFVATRGGYLRVGLGGGSDDGRVRSVAVDDAAGVDFTAIAHRADGLLALGTADGAVYTLGSDTAVKARLKIFARVDALAVQGNTVAVLDRGQTSVTTVDPSGEKAQHALRAGEGATTIAADPQARFLVADTRGESLLVFGTDPLMLRQRYPVGGAPYGLAGSQKLAWVSETATNVVVGYDLATGIPVEKVRHRTVQQPNSLAFDDASNTLFVVSGSGAGVQVIRDAVPGS